MGSWNSIFFLQFWELEIQDEGTRRYSSWSGLFLVCRWPPSGYIFTWLSPGVWTWRKRERSYKDTNPITRALWWPQLYLIPSQRPQLQEHLNWGRHKHSSGSDGKESKCNAGDPGLIPGWGRSPAEGNGYLLQYSCLENSMIRGAGYFHGSQGVGHN